jgi:putative transposase
MISAANVDHAPFLSGERAKVIVRDKLKSLIVEFDVKLRAWVILNDHYHLLLKTARGKDLSRFFGQLHGSTSRQINLWDGTKGRQVWHNYWDTCVRDERGLWTRFNYIHHNPVKHGYVQAMEDWPFSSYHYYLRTKGREWLLDCWSRYPVVDSLESDVLEQRSG